ncbi:MAG TPA: PEP-CTERM sorting domain-containing protein [Burkholderiales bacterium]|nr:PEP-CTERM sorting domain-containing protein [Burkholderiales bacterium]
MNSSQNMAGALRFNNVDQAFYATPPYFAANNSSVFAPQAIAGLTGSSRATGINNRNLVVGFDSSGANGVSQSFVYTIGGSVQRVRELSSSTPNQAYAINTGGMIAGWAANAAGESQAFLARTAHGAVTQPTITGSHWSEARAINTSGDIAGCFAGRVITGGDCSGAVSPGGTSTGDSTGSEIRAFIVQGGKATVLDLPAGYTESFALGISAHDIVVGTAHAFDQTGHLAKSTAFLWANGATLDLSLLLPPHDPGNPNTGWESFVTATAITEGPINTVNGLQVITATVVGQGMIWASDPLNPTGPFTLQPHAFRLDVAVTVPEPQTWMLLMAGIGLLVWTIRQRARATFLRGDY